MPQIVPNLWFDGQAEEAAEFYVSLFPDSRIHTVARYTEAGPGPAGTVVTVEFELDGQRFVAINGGPQYSFSPAVSFSITCRTPEELDHYWDGFADGGTPVQCGWITDRYGLSWQVVPEGLDLLIGDPDPARAQRAMTEMLGQVKLDIEAIRRAADAG